MLPFIASNKPAQRMQILLIIATALLFAYLPAVQTDYVFHDDLYYFTDWKRDGCMGYSQMHAYIHLSARPVGGVVKCLEGIFIETIQDAKYVRLFNIFMLSAFCFLVFSWLSRFCISLPHALAISILTGVLTAYQTPIAQITNAHHILAAILALLALMLQVKNVETEHGKPRWITGALVYLLLVTSVLMYPISTMVYWSFLSVYVLFGLPTVSMAEIKKLFRIGLPVIIALFAPFIWAKIFGADASRSTLTTDPIGKIEWFVSTRIPIAWSYWEPYASPLFHRISLGIIALAGVVLWFKSTHKPTYVIKLAICMGLVCLSFAPALVLAHEIGNHRVSIAISTLLVLYTIFSLIYVAKTIHQCYGGIFTVYVLAMMCVFGLSGAHYNLATYYANPSHLEYNFLKHKLSAIDFLALETSKIHIVTAKLPYLSARNWEDEFGIPSSYWAPDTHNYVVAIARELNLPIGYHQSFRNGLVTVGTENEVKGGPLNGQPVQPNRIVINMNDIRGLLVSPNELAEKPSWVH